MVPRPVPQPSPPGGAGRRALLLGATAWCTAAAGCAKSTGTPAAAGVRTQAGAAHATAPAPAPSGTLPAAVPWRPGPGEIEPAVKLAAVRLVEALGTWPAGRGGPRNATARAAALGISTPQAARFAAEAGPLTPVADQAVVRVIDAQYGGLLPDTASVLIPCAQSTRTGSTVREGGTTIDVRLERTAAGWAVTALHPGRPGRPAAAPGAPARAVLAQPRIELPPGSAADIRSGAVHESVLRAMLRLADTYRFSVSVVRSGHPVDVFGTSRPSDHPLGRAFDVWAVDGRPVVDPATPRSLVTAFMRAAAAAGSYNVGGPVRLSGGTRPNQFFSDATHHDHVHIGFAA
ncbi:hypothetical protein EDE04_6587 [Streptomyces sp. 2132.2]|uniref:hypothetical protein n=1 Tax=Streptomyces sp. 2132.2 TaxID=2485161 RepID=UPI000F49A498|nr:hypothetical protein [Streptomyces sp. 2132.2]ROR00030.1 hypothetical protein EDE04_6587 [Streptomyces sp. 2132.2]